MLILGRKASESVVIDGAVWLTIKHIEKKVLIIEIVNGDKTETHAPLFADDTIEVMPDVSVTVLSIHGARTRLGFEAPKHIDVDREEIFHKKAEAA